MFVYNTDETVLFKTWNDCKYYLPLYFYKSNFYEFHGNKIKEMKTTK